MKRRIEPSDLLSPEAYGQVRKARRQAVIAQKQKRRFEVGPFATFHFENYDTMLLQVQEMLYIERGGEAQIEDELRAYNPLIPQGQELVATLLLEIEDPVRRARLLAQLGGIEHTTFLQFAGETVKGVPEGDIERTNEAGKTSSVHFLHFPFTPAQIEKFRAPGTQVIVGFTHANYPHMAAMPETARQTLAEDFA